MFTHILSPILSFLLNVNGGNPWSCESIFSFCSFAACLFHNKKGTCFRRADLGKYALSVSAIYMVNGYEIGLIFKALPVHGLLLLLS